MTNEINPQRRRHPAHHPPVYRDNRSILVFLTVCTQGRKRILCSDKVDDLLKKTWKQLGDWLVGRYILMPDHLHLFCAPGRLDEPSLAKWVKAWKSVSAATWPDKGDGKVWQRDFWDTQLRRGESYSEKWEYVRRNPVRKVLVSENEQWPYQGELNQLMWHDEV